MNSRKAEITWAYEKVDYLGPTICFAYQQRSAATCLYTSGGRCPLSKLHAKCRNNPVQIEQVKANYRVFIGPKVE